VGYAIAHFAIFRKLKERLGFDRVRVAFSGAAPISPDILVFFHAIGVPLREGYGQTEGTGVITVAHGDQIKLGTVGQPLPGCEVRIAEDGEILVKSSMVFKGYLKEPEKTREVLSEDGWYATGDIGTLDKDGFLWITDRKKDILITAGGKNVAPQNIENALKTSPVVSQAMVYGDRKPYLTGLITLDPDEIKKWAQSQGIETRDYKALTAHPKVFELLESIVHEKGKELARYEQIKYFRILPEEFSQDGGTLTATLKVRRREVIKRYGNLIEEMYKE
jgi:long-chain acyl-CoA synthetase